MEYTFLHCLHPVKVVNPYTKETMVVPCGHCEACRLNKANRNTFQCDLETAGSCIPYFVTLTYRNSAIPRATLLESTEEIGCFDLFDKETGELLSDVSVSFDCKVSLEKKFRLFGDVPYLRKSDLVNFLKRLRYYATQISPSAKIRYYAVGEYGPVHFRPHYHLLLWSQNAQIRSNMENLVSKAWTLGLTDTQLSQGGSSKYVASYVNSFGNLPKLYTARSVSPFCLHSQFLGQAILQMQKKEVYEITAQSFIRRCLPINGENVSFNLWRSCYSRWFPKCLGFTSSSTSEVHSMYVIYRTLTRVFGHQSSRELGEILASLCLNTSSDPYKLTDILNHYHVTISFYRETIESVIRVILRNRNVSSCYYNYDDFCKFVMVCYNIVRLSKHFITFVCDGNGEPTTFEIKRKISLIKDFYKSLDMMNLSDFFESQKQYFDSEYYDDEQSDYLDENHIVPYFYNNYPHSEEVYALPAYKIFRDEIINKCTKKIKHKRLNDENQIFIDLS